MSELETFGNYHLIKKIAQGGMAEIFLASPKGNENQFFVLKRILPHLLEKKNYLNMFLDEVKIAKRLKHSNIVQTFDSGQVDGRYYLVLEYVNGITLSQLVYFAKKANYQLPAEVIAYIGSQVLKGLQHAHSLTDDRGVLLQIVHRDVNPQNVMLSYEGHIKLLDFGIYKGKQRLTETEVGLTKGKLSYMSPEQAKGDPLDGRSDLFAVAIIMYEMLQGGKKLFHRSDSNPAAVLNDIVHGKVVSIREKNPAVDERLSNIIMKALSKKPSQRFFDARDMQLELEKFLAAQTDKIDAFVLKRLISSMVHRRGDYSAQPDAPSAFHQASNDPPTQAQAMELTQTILRFQQAQHELSQENREPDLSKVAESVGAGITDRKDFSATPLQLSEPQAHPSEKDIQGSEAFFPQKSHHQKVKSAFFLLLGCSLFLGLVTFGYRYYQSKNVAKIENVQPFVQKLDEKQKLELSPSFADKKNQNIQEIQSDEAQKNSKTASIRIESNPEGATIRLNGVDYHQTTPTIISSLFLYRTYTIEVRKTGYKPKVLPVFLKEADKESSLFISLDKALGSVFISSEPSDATVTVNEKIFEEHTPATIVGLETGIEHHIIISKENYKNSLHSITLQEDGEKSHIEAMLEIDIESIPKASVDLFSDPASCSVVINRKEIGKTPIYRFMLQPDQDFTISITCSDYHQYVQKIHSKPKQHFRINPTLTPKGYGFLTVETVPDGAGVKLNDTVIGQTPLINFRVRPGNYKAEVFLKAQQISRSFEFRSEINKTVSRKINLLTGT